MHEHGSNPQSAVATDEIANRVINMPIYVQLHFCHYIYSICVFYKMVPVRCFFLIYLGIEKKRNANLELIQEH